MAFIQRFFLRSGAASATFAGWCLWAVLITFSTRAAYAEPGSAIKLAVTVPPLRFVVKELVGEQADVEVLLPPGANHEAYEPSIAHVRALAEAEIFFSLQHPNFETERLWLKRLQEMKRGKPLLVIPTMDHAFVRPEDIHCWLSVSSMRGIAKVIADALKQRLPANSEAISQKYAALLQRFSDLDRELQTELHPYSGQSFLVFHPAWGYFAADYNLTQLSIEHEGKEPSIAQFEKLVQEAGGIRAIIVEPLAPPASVRFLNSELGLEVLQLDPLKEQWIEGMELAGKTIAKAISSRSSAQADPSPQSSATPGKE